MTQIATHWTCNYSYNSILQFKNVTAIARIAPEDNSIIHKWKKMGKINYQHILF
jgi:hypothetical protein